MPKPAAASSSPLNYKKDKKGKDSKKDKKGKDSSKKDKDKKSSKKDKKEKDDSVVLKWSPALHGVGLPSRREVQICNVDILTRHCPFLVQG